MDLQAIEQLILLMESSTLTAMEAEEGGLRVRLERGGVQVTSMMQSTPIQSVTASPAKTKTAAVPTPSVSSELDEKEENWLGSSTVDSPIVGTYHTLSGMNRGEDIAIGDRVKQGQVLCVVEAMKLMNEILCETDGEIAMVCCKEGDMVEFGQTLFRIK